MLNEITIGQYFPGESIIHKIDPRMKLIIGISYLALLFLSSNIYSLCVGVVFLLITFPLSKISIRLCAKSMKPMLPLIALSVIFNMLLTDGEILYQIGIVIVTDRGLLAAIFMGVRIVCLVVGTSLLTYTTSTMALTHGIEQLFLPLQKFNVPIHEIAMMMTIALRFIPTLIEETDKIMLAQKARGADMESGNIFNRARGMVPVLIPLFMAAFRRADELALAMECRGYTGGNGRTRMNELQYTKLDALSVIFMIISFIAVMYFNHQAPKTFY